MCGCSTAKYNVRYAEMLSNDDSSVQKAVYELEPYGKDAEIHKLECVNHAISGWGQLSEN